MCANLDTDNNEVCHSPDSSNVESEAKPDIFSDLGFRWGFGSGGMEVVMEEFKDLERFAQCA
ncbi:hypothetical protein E2562_010291 [Oryza meyeriana var. granulata]|uniref:Uncharacterized protein n=1 Tax=Oryza meyeriana var. granulata TaxID=110450 RepID=A0A6G1F653_9ORYZ|nr:hypothetical protein E2562_010291 [Oryza meyeriana var. granulata]